jgi:hypothetical protein
MNGTLLNTGRLARAELRKLFTTKALPVSSAIAIVPGIEKWLPTAAAIGLADIPRPAHGLSPTTAGLVLAGYAIALLLAASRTTMRRDLA